MCECVHLHTSVTVLPGVPAATLAVGLAQARNVAVPMFAGQRLARTEALLFVTQNTSVARHTAAAVRVGVYGHTGAPHTPEREVTVTRSAPFNISKLHAKKCLLKL